MCANCLVSFALHFFCCYAPFTSFPNRRNVQWNSIGIQFVDWLSRLHQMLSNIYWKWMMLHWRTKQPGFCLWTYSAWLQLPALSSSKYENIYMTSLANFWRSNSGIGLETELGLGLLWWRASWTKGHGKYAFSLRPIWYTVKHDLSREWAE